MPNAKGQALTSAVRFALIDSQKKSREGHSNGMLEFF